MRDREREYGQENIIELGKLKDQLFTFHQVLRAETSLSRVELDAIHNTDNAFPHLFACFVNREIK